MCYLASDEPDRRIGPHPSGTDTVGLGALIALSMLWAAPPALPQDLVDAFRIGNGGTDVARAIAGDHAGGAWLGGEFGGTIDVDPGPGLVELTASGQRDGLLARFDRLGRLRWAGQVGGEPGDNVQIADLLIAEDGSIVVVGAFEGSVDFDPGPGRFVLTSRGGSYDAFVLSLAGTGAFRWAGDLGGVGLDDATAVVVRPGGRFLLGGRFEGTADLDPGPAVLNVTSAGGADAFLVELTESGALDSARVLAGTSTDTVTALAESAAGGVLIGGSFRGTTDFDPGPGELLLTTQGVEDGFLVSLDDKGALLRAGQIGGPAVDQVMAVASGADGAVFFGGCLSDGADLDPDPDATFVTPSAGGSDGFVAKLTPEGELSWVRTVQGRQIECVQDLAVSDDGGVVAAGGFSSFAARFDLPDGEFFQLRGGSNAFVWRIRSSGSFHWAAGLGLPGAFANAYALAGLPNDELVITGAFTGTGDFDPGPGTFELMAEGLHDLYLARLRSVDEAPTVRRVPGDYPTIQQAIDDARHFDRVLVAPGTYEEQLTFRGQHIELRSLVGPAVTILDGGGSGPVVTFEDGEGSAALLEGFTVRNGEQVAALSGGGVWVTGSAAPRIRGNVITGNRSCSGGGGIRVDVASPSIETNRITDNHRTEGCSGGLGGGGILLKSSGGALRGNFIADNTWASSPISSGGGAIAFWGGSVTTVRDNTIVGNSSTGPGGALYFTNHPSPRIIQNLIIGNESTTRGGAVFLPSAASPQFVNNSFVSNSAPDGSVFFLDANQDDMVMSNNVLVGNGTAPLLSCDDEPPILEHNAFHNPSGPVVGGACAGAIGTNGNVEADPLFVDSENGDFRLSHGSPLIDVGTNAAPSLPDLDFQGAPRIQDGDRDGEPVVDPGVYETEPLPTLIFEDGFESGDTGAWSEVRSTCP